MYCTRECQVAHWSVHKPLCGGGRKKDKDLSWVDFYRNGHDGSCHLGTLELVTWDFVDADGTELGWGGCFREESADLKAKFEGAMKSNPKKLLKHFDEAYRWTCCGMSVGEGVYGCDHHGDLKNPVPCKCDYCRSGRPVPDRIYLKQTTHKVGLTLRRGPDPRSFSYAGKMNYDLGKSLGFIED